MSSKFCKSFTVLLHWKNISFFIKQGILVDGWGIPEDLEVSPEWWPVWSCPDERSSSYRDWNWKSKNLSKNLSGGRLLWSRLMLSLKSWSPKWQTYLLAEINKSESLNFKQTLVLTQKKSFQINSVTNITHFK
jgi:hypothetical protein